MKCVLPLQGGKPVCVFKLRNKDLTTFTTQDKITKTLLSDLFIFKKLNKSVQIRMIKSAVRYKMWPNCWRPPDKLTTLSVSEKDWNFDQIVLIPKNLITVEPELQVSTQDVICYPEMWCNRVVVGGGGIASGIFPF